MRRFANSGISCIKTFLVSNIIQETDIYIDLSNNLLTSIDLTLLPANILSIDLDNNEIAEINFGDRNWNKISLNCNSLKISSLQGINCNQLDLNNNVITNINIDNCNINKLGLINNNINQINFNNCQIETLLLCTNNIKEITNLPETLKILDLSNNKIKIIDKLPTNLIKLDLSNNKISTLPTIPSNLMSLDISYNRFNQFDNILPESLNELVTHGNNMDNKKSQSHFDLYDNFGDNFLDDFEIIERGHSHNNIEDLMITSSEDEVDELNPDYESFFEGLVNKPNTDLETLLKSLNESRETEPDTKTDTKTEIQEPEYARLIPIRLQWSVIL